MTRKTMWIKFILYVIKCITAFTVTCVSVILIMDLISYHNFYPSTYEQQERTFIKRLYPHREDPSYTGVYKYSTDNVEETERILQDTIKRLGFKVVYFQSFKTKLVASYLLKKDIIYTEFIIEKE